jgi:branched-chain amino acid transport system permease protein
MNRLGIWLLFLAAIALPLALRSTFYVDICTQVLIASIFAASYNILIGQARLISLGHAAAFGVGAYLVTIAVGRYGLPHLAAIAVALIGALLVAAALAAFALRTAGIAFMMTTLAVSQLLWGIAGQWVAGTGGENGLTGLRRPTLLALDLESPPVFYYVILVCAVVAHFYMWRFAISPLGALLRGARDQPTRLTALGHDVWLIRFIGLVYAGFWAAVAGVLYAYFHEFVSPQVLSVETSIEPLVMVILGGVSTVAGPILGAAIIVLMQQVVSSYVAAWPTLLGIAMIAILMFMPAGLASSLSRLWDRARFGRIAPRR